MKQSKWVRIVGTLGALAASAACAQTAPVTPASAEAYQFNRTIGEPSLPIAFVFGDPTRFCLPGDSACRQPAFASGIGQPAAVVVASTTIGDCPIEIRTGNIALQTYVRRTTKYSRGVNTNGFSFPYLQPYNADSAYFTAVIDLVAVPLDAARCKAGVVAAGAKDLGHLSWGGTVNLAGYDLRMQPATTVNLATPALRKLRIQWDARSISLHIDDCRPALFETPVYQARGTAPAALFPVIAPQVLLAPAPAASATTCKRLNLAMDRSSTVAGRTA